MGIFNEQSSDHPFARGIQGAPGVGFNLTSSGDYDMINKKLRNVGAPSANTDAATKKYVDDNSSGTPSTSRLTVDSNIDMKDRFRILNLKHPLDADEPATKQYSDSRFLDRNGSRTMIGNLSMNNNKIIKLGAPTANDDAATKKYVDDITSSGGSSGSSLDLSNYLKKDGSVAMTGPLKMGTPSPKNYNQIKFLEEPTNSHNAATKGYVDKNSLRINGTNSMNGNINMGNNLIEGLGQPQNNSDAATKVYVDHRLNMRLKKDGTEAMTGNLNVGNNKIVGLATPVSNTDAATKKYVDDKTSSSGGSGSGLDLSNYLKKDGSVAMTGDFNTGGHKILNLRTPTTNSEPATKKYVDDNTGAPDLSDYLEKDGSVAMTGNLNVGNNKIVNLSDPTTDQQAANRGWVRKQIDRLDHHSGDASGGVFTITDPAAATTLYLQFVSGSSFDDFVFTTSAPGQPLVGWAPTANTYINKIEFQFGSRNINVDFLWFIPRDSSHSNSNFWVSGNRTGTWSLIIHKSWNYNMSGVRLRTHNNSNHTAITCRLFTDLPKAITKPLKRIEINTPKIVISGVIKADIDLGGNKIENLGVPTQDNEAVTKGYVDYLVHHTAIQPSHYKDEFAYLMSSGSQWTDESVEIGSSFLIKRIGDLAPNKGNFHDYNHKVIYAAITKNILNRYQYKMGINFYRLTANTDYTLCLEILNTDYNLWNNSRISVDKGTSTGLSIGNVIEKKLFHKYTDAKGKTQTMYYHRIIVNFRKLTSGKRFFLHILVRILQGGFNMNAYPRQFLGTYIIAYGIMGTFSNIDADKVYDYHTAFDIKPTEVVYNVDINANNKKILNINLDRSNNNSAATVAFVKELAPHTKNLLYRSYFSEFYDFTNANNYKLTRGVSGVVFNYLASITGNTLRDVGIPNRTMDDITNYGLNVKGYSVAFTLPNNITKYSLCISFYHWRNRSFSLTKKNSVNDNILVKLDYNKSNNKVTLTVNKTTQNFTMPGSFNGHKIVVWLVENFNSNVTKVSISNYSSTLTIPAIQKSSLQEFDFTTEDGVLNKIMYSPNFYDTDSDQYHKVMLQEKLNGSYIT